MSLRDLQLSLMLKMVDRISGPAKKAGLVNRQLSKRLGQTRDAIKAVNQHAKKVEHLKKLNASMGESGQKADAARKRLSGLWKEFNQAKKAGRSTKRLEQSIASTKRQIDKLSGSHNKLKSKAHAARSELRKAGIDTRNLGAAQEKLERQTKKLNRQFKRQQKTMMLVRGAGRKLGSGLGKLKKAGLWGVGAGLAVGIAGSIPLISTAAQFEGYEAVLTTIEGSSAKAAKSMQWVSDFAARTPYELSQVNEAFVRLRAYGMDPTNGMLKTLGDTGAAMGKPVMAAVEAIADAITGENERLKEFGIKARADGDLFRYTFTDKQGIQRELAALKTDRKSISQTLQKIWSEKYSGAMDRLSKTWSGMVSNVKDQWTRFLKMIMDSGPFARLKGYLQSLLDNLNAMARSGELQQWAEKVGDKILIVLDNLAVIGKFLLQTIDVIAGGIKTGGKFVDVLGKIGDTIGTTIAQSVYLQQKFLNIGREIIEGLGKGITEKMTWLKAKILSIGDLLPNWLKEKLDIHSPSRVFAKLGGHISEGIGVGIEAKSKKALNAISRLGQQIPGALPTAMAIGLASGTAQAGPSMINGAGTLSGGGVTYQTNTINVYPAPGMDEQALAEAVAKEVQKLNNQATARRRSHLFDEV